MFMKVKILEATHELDLQDAINEFLEDNNQIDNMYYSVALTSHNGELEYTFSCMIVYS